MGIDKKIDDDEWLDFDELVEKLHHMDIEYNRKNNIHILNFIEDDDLGELEDIDQECFPNLSAYEKLEEPVSTVCVGGGYYWYRDYGHRSTIEDIAIEIGREAESLYIAILDDLHSRDIDITGVASQNDIHNSLKEVLPTLNLKHLGSIEIPSHLCALKKGNPRKNFVEKIIQLFVKKQGRRITLEEAGRLYRKISSPIK